MWEQYLQLTSAQLAPRFPHYIPPRKWKICPVSFILSLGSHETSIKIKQNENLVWKYFYPLTCQWTFFRVLSGYALDNLQIIYLALHYSLLTFSRLINLKISQFANHLQLLLLFNWKLFLQTAENLQNKKTRSTHIRATETPKSERHLFA